MAEMFPDFTMCDFMHRIAPSQGDGAGDYLVSIDSTLEILREWCADEDFFGNRPYVAFPEPGGLLPWGESNEGDIFCWKTGDPDPDKWPVALGSRSSTWDEHEGGMLNYMVGLLRGDILPHGLPDIFTRPNPKLYVYED
jgi:hypothetical protein